MYIIYGIIILFFVLAGLEFQKKRKQRNKILSLVDKMSEIDAKEFLKLRSDASSKRYIIRNDFEGIYILFNKKKKIYYVGQSVNVLKRVNNHFTGKGNGDVYADFKYGAKFNITTIPIKGSGFSNLDDLEKDAIKVFKAFDKGYNKTRGNK